MKSNKNYVTKYNYATVVKNNMIYNKYKMTQIKIKTTEKKFREIIIPAQEIREVIRQELLERREREKQEKEAQEALLKLKALKNRKNKPK